MRLARRHAAAPARLPPTRHAPRRSPSVVHRAPHAATSPDAQPPPAPPPRPRGSPPSTPRPRLAALVVVEGASDANVVAAAVDAPVHVLAGATRARNAASVAALAAAARAAGAAVLLFDPDAAGRTGRGDAARALAAAAPGVPLYHAFVPVQFATAAEHTRHKSAGDVGIEHAAPAVVAAALARATRHSPGRVEFTAGELAAAGLTAAHDAGGAGRTGARRAAVAAALGLGTVTGAQLLRMLNECGISRRDYERALQAADGVVGERERVE